MFDGADTVTTFTDESNLSFTAPTSTAVEGIVTITVRNPSGGVSARCLFHDHSGCRSSIPVQ